MKRRWIMTVGATLGISTCQGLGACALLSKAEPRVPRYFTPEDDAASGVGERDAVRERPANGAELKRLRLGTVRGGSQLRERIMFRTSAHELGYYDDRRWTERPEVYLRRALVRVLFEERGLFHVVSGYAPALDVELLAFEVVRAPQSKVRVRVAFTLDNDRVGKVSQTITVEQALPSSKGDADAEAAVGALAVALKRCVDQIADSVMSNHASDSPPAGLAASPR